MHRPNEQKHPVGRPPHAPLVTAEVEAKLLPALRNWQVIEIDGVATPVPDSAPPTDAQPLDEPAGLIEDHPDDLIVAALDVRRVTVAAGQGVTLRLLLLNNGDRPAAFEVQVEGWIDEAWVQVTPLDVAPGNSDRSTTWLRPAEQTTLAITITPPRAPTVLAGGRDLAVVVRSPQYPGRLHRLGARLIVQPYTELAFGHLQVGAQAISWRRQAIWLLLPVSNRSNHETIIYLHGQALNGQCQLQFQAADQKKNSSVVLAAGLSLALQPMC